MQWLERDFLGYLDHWEESVWAREGFTPDYQEGSCVQSTLGSFISCGSDQTTP